MSINKLQLCSLALIASAALLSISPAHAGDVEEGEELFNYWCAGCHGATGMATMLQQRRYQGAIPAQLSERTNLSKQYVHLVTRNWWTLPAMPAFRQTELNDEQMDKVAAYLTRNNP